MLHAPVHTGLILVALARKLCRCLQLRFLIAFRVLCRAIASQVLVHLHQDRRNCPVQGAINPLLRPYACAIRMQTLQAQRGAGQGMAAPGASRSPHPL